MSESRRLLELIEKGVIEHGGDLGGWTRYSDDRLQLFDGRVTLRIHLEDPSPSTNISLHAHVLTTLHEYQDEILDACIIGMGDNLTTALKEASLIWITAVAGPIKSFLDDKPLCMSCRAGVANGDPSVVTVTPPASSVPTSKIQAEASKVQKQKKRCNSPA